MGVLRASPSDTVEDRLTRYSVWCPFSGCRNWQAYKVRGYGRLRLAGHDVLAHRLAWCVERGSIPNGLHVLHHCDNRACINVDHLFLGTNDDNVADKVAKGRQARGDLICAKTRGENHYRSLIDASTARAIRAATGSLNQIAAAFSTTKSVVQGVRSGKNWRNA